MDDFFANSAEKNSSVKLTKMCQIEITKVHNFFLQKKKLPKVLEQAVGQVDVTLE